MADDYWVDIVHGRPKGHHYVNDYDIVMPHAHVGDRQFAAVGKKYRLAAEVEAVGGHHHHHRSRSRRYWGQPLFYVPDYGDVAVNSTATDPDEIPDAVEGPIKGVKDTLNPNDWLNPGQFLQSKNKRVKLIMQKDGNLVLYGDGVALWNSGTNGRGANRAFMQTDGNFVVYAGAGGPSATALWNSATAGLGGAKLIVQDDGNAVVYFKGRAFWNTETHGFKKYTSHSFGGDLVHAFNTVASIAGAPVHAVTDVLEKIPIVGPVIHEGLALDPVKALGGMTASVLQGERIDKAFLATAKDQLHHIREVAPYVQTVMSFVPGVGTGVAAAIAAGTALAEGRTISDAVIDGISKAVPGGALGKSVLAGALAITHGDSVSSIVLNTVKSNLPANLRTAVDTAVAAAGGKNVRVAVLQALSKQLPPEAKKALDIGIALGAARNIQSTAVNAVTNPANIAKLAAKPLPAPFQKKVPMKEAKGYKATMGLLQHKGVTAHTIAALHSALPPAEKKGAEQAVKDYKNHFTQLSHTSLVRGGLVTRGNWKQVAANTKGAVPGRLVKGKAVTVGHFVRV